MRLNEHTFLLQKPSWYIILYIPTKEFSMKGSQSYSIDRENIADRIIENETVVLNLDNGMYYSLNEVGTHIWRFLDQGKSIDEIIAHLAAMYTVTQKNLTHDVATLIDELVKERLIKQKRSPR